MKSFIHFLGAILGTFSIAKALNPIVQTSYTADPAPMVYGGRVYMFTGHDEDGSTYYNMTNWKLFSSDDMANWKDHGSPMSYSTFSWANADAWAGQVIERNGKFYYYVPIHRASTNRMAIGVGVSNNIEGPYVDAIGRPLVENGQIDPTVFIDDDGQAYLYWGNPGLWYVKLNKDMISYDGTIHQVELTTAGFGTRNGNPDRPTTFEEGPWLFKRNGLYYMVYAANCCSEDIRYSTGPSATGPWTYRGLIMRSQGRSFTNHPGFVDFQGRSYFAYHNGALPGGSGYTRSVAIESFAFNSDGTIPEMSMSTKGPDQIKWVDPYTKQEAETIAWAQGVKTETCSEGGMNVAYIERGDSILVKGVDFGAGAKSFSARVSSGTNGGKIELRLDSTTGTLLGTCTAPATGGWQTWTTVDCTVGAATGIHDLAFVFTGDGTGYLFNFNWWVFKRS